jgi:hypothetical protein
MIKAIGKRTSKQRETASRHQELQRFYRGMQRTLRWGDFDTVIQAAKRDKTRVTWIPGIHYEGERS